MSRRRTPKRPRAKEKPKGPPPAPAPAPIAPWDVRLDVGGWGSGGIPKLVGEPKHPPFDPSQIPTSWSEILGKRQPPALATATPPIEVCYSADVANRKLCHAFAARFPEDEYASDFCFSRYGFSQEESPTEAEIAAMLEDATTDYLRPLSEEQKKLMAGLEGVMRLIGGLLGGVVEVKEDKLFPPSRSLFWTSDVVCGSLRFANMTAKKTDDTPTSTQDAVLPRRPAYGKPPLVVDGRGHVFDAAEDKSSPKPKRAPLLDILGQFVGQSPQDMLDRLVATRQAEAHRHQQMERLGLAKLVGSRLVKILSHEQIRALADIFRCYQRREHAPSPAMFIDWAKRFSFAGQIQPLRAQGVICERAGCEEEDPHVLVARCQIPLLFCSFECASLYMGEEVCFFCGHPFSAEGAVANRAPQRNVAPDLLPIPRYCSLDCARFGQIDEALTEELLPDSCGPNLTKYRKEHMLASLEEAARLQQPMAPVDEPAQPEIESSGPESDASEPEIEEAPAPIEDPFERLSAAVRSMAQPLSEEPSSR